MSLESELSGSAETATSSAESSGRACSTHSALHVVLAFAVYLVLPLLFLHITEVFRGPKISGVDDRPEISHRFSPRYAASAAVAPY